LFVSVQSSYESSCILGRDEPARRTRVGTGHVVHAVSQPAIPTTPQLPVVCATEVTTSPAIELACAGDIKLHLTTNQSYQASLNSQSLPSCTSPSSALGVSQERLPRLFRSILLFSVLGILDGSCRRFHLCRSVASASTRRAAAILLTQHDELPQKC
jgi:hypothetical protein